MALRPSALFFLPDTTTVLARSAMNLLKAANQAALDEAITTIQNRSLTGPGVMAHLEQNVHFGEVLEKLAKEWSPQTQRTFGLAFNMDAGKTDIMDLIVAIAILNEADLEAELRDENTPEATATDLLENRRITWQYPPPGTLLDPPYLVLVAVEHVDTTKADSEVQSILGELIDYKGFKIPQRATLSPLRPGLIKTDLLATRPDMLAKMSPLASTVASSIGNLAQPTTTPQTATESTSPAAAPAPSTPAAATTTVSSRAISASAAALAAASKASRFTKGL